MRKERGATIVETALVMALVAAVGMMAVVEAGYQTCVSIAQSGIDFSLKGEDPPFDPFGGTVGGSTESICRPPRP